MGKTANSAPTLRRGRAVYPVRLSAPKTAEKTLVNDEAFFLRLLQGGHDAILVDGANGAGSYFQRNPSIFLGNIEALLLQVRIKLALRLVVGVRHVVAYAGTLAG